MGLPLALVFSGGGLFGAWLPFGNIFLDLPFSLLVRCEGNYYTLNVVSLWCIGMPPLVSLVILS